MHYLSASISILLLVVIVNEGEGQVIPVQQDWDQIAQESRPQQATIKQIDGPKYVTQPSNNSAPTTVSKTNKPDLARPPSKPPITTSPIQGKQLKFVEMTPPRPGYYNQQGNIPPAAYNKPKPKPPHGPYKYPKVIPISGLNRHQYYTQGTAPNRQPTLVYSASSGKPVYIKGTNPKFSIPVQTINGIRSTEVRPPRIPHNATTSTTTTTTVKPIRNKRIWPKHILDKMNTTYNNTRLNNTLTVTNVTDQETSPSIQIRRYVTKINTSTEATTRGYKRVNRRPNHRSTTASPLNETSSDFRPNDWVPIVPPHFQNVKRYVPKAMRRSDSQQTINQTPAQDRRMLFLHSIGLVPVHRMPVAGKKKMMVFFRKPKRQLKPNISSSYRRRPMSRPRRVVHGDLHAEGSHPRVVTKIKHHHHHHHHKYIKTVEKPVKVPYKVEVPKPYPVPVEKRVPYPVEKVKIVEKKVPFAVPYEKKVPYPVQVKVPQPFPVKVVEKEYVPKPYPVVQQVIKHVKVPQPVPVQVEKQVPYPVHVKVPVPVDRPVPVPVPFEKKVHVPVPVRVLVPQPYPVEKKVPYPVEVKVREPYEVIKHVQVPIKIPVPHPVPIKVPQPVPITIEKKVPYPVEVEKKVPVPFKVYIPQRVEVEKKVYIPKPYPVEKKVAVPFKVQVPVEVPVKVPVEVPVPIYVGHLSTPADYSEVTSPPIDVSSLYTGISTVTQPPHHTVTVHGNGAFKGFSDRSDTPTTTSTPGTQ